MKVYRFPYLSTIHPKGERRRPQIRYGTVTNLPFSSSPHLNRRSIMSVPIAISVSIQAKVSKQSKAISQKPFSNTMRSSHRKAVSLSSLLFALFGSSVGVTGPSWPWLSLWIYFRRSSISSWSCFCALLSKQIRANDIISESIHAIVPVKKAHPIP